MLLSLALMLLVVTVAYTGLVLFQNITVAGRADAERAQLARAIERRMTSDIRCVLYQEPKPVESAEEEESNAGLAEMNEDVGAADDTGGTTTAPSGAGNTTGITTNSTAGGTTVSTTSTPTDAYASQSMGVYGNATTLVLHVSKPSRESAEAMGLADPMLSGSMMGAAGTSPISRASDLRSISYFLAVAGGGGLQGAVGNSASGGTAMFTTSPGSQGLARLDGDRLQIQQADAMGETDLLAQQAEILAPEVTDLQFRYFDGVAWVATWDSVAAGALPRAIEVTLRINVGSEVQGSALVEEASEEAASSSSELYRFVVALPLSDPTLGMAL